MTNKCNLVRPALLDILFHLIRSAFNGNPIGWSSAKSKAILESAKEAESGRNYQLEVNELHRKRLLLLEESSSILKTGKRVEHLGLVMVVKSPPCLGMFGLSMTCEYVNGSGSILEYDFNQAQIEHIVGKIMEEESITRTQ